ncbi:MAG: hypothetical protein ACRETE_06965, partial [Stenotrophobium sp.]
MIDADKLARYAAGVLTVPVNSWSRQDNAAAEPWAGTFVRHPPATRRFCEAKRVRERAVGC